MDVEMQKRQEEHTEAVKHSPKFTKMSDRTAFNSAFDAYKKDMSMHESTLKHALGNMCIDFDIQCDYNCFLNCKCAEVYAYPPTRPINNDGTNSVGQCTVCECKVRKGFRILGAQMVPPTHGKMKPLCSTARPTYMMNDHNQVESDETVRESHEDSVDVIIMDPGLLSQDSEDDKPNHSTAALCSIGPETHGLFNLPFQATMQEDEILLEKFKKAYQKVLNEISRSTGVLAVISNNPPLDGGQTQKEEKAKSRR